MVLLFKIRTFNSQPTHQKIIEYVTYNVDKSLRFETLILNYPRYSERGHRNKLLHVIIN
jgi:hypothetical protein